MKFKTKHRSRPTQGGATLIEALVAILVMSIGLLGIAGMQLNALSFQKSSWATHRIAELSGDIAERMRANPTGATNGNYVYTADYATAAAATLASNGCRPTPPVAAPACTALQIANDDLSDWLAKARASLPGGAVRIEGSSTAGYTVTTMYVDKEFVNAATGAAQTSTACTAAMTSIDWRNCCPAAVSAPAGVRCSRSLLLP